MSIHKMFYLNLGHGIEYLPIPSGRFSPSHKERRPARGVNVEEEEAVIAERPVDGDIAEDEIVIEDDDDEKEVDYGDADEDKEDKEEEDKEDKEEEIKYGEDVVPEDAVQEAGALIEQAIKPTKKYVKEDDVPAKRLNPRDASLRKLDYTHLKNLITLLTELTGVDATLLIPEKDDSENRVRMRVNVINLRDRLETSERNFRFMLQKLGLAIDDIRPSDLAYLHPLMEAMTTPRRTLPATLTLQVQEISSQLGDQLMGQLHTTFSSNFAAFQAVAKVISNLLATHAETDKYRNVYIKRALRLLTASLLSSLPVIYDNYMKSIEDHVKTVFLLAAMKKAGVEMKDL